MAKKNSEKTEVKSSEKILRNFSVPFRIRREFQ